MTEPIQPKLTLKHLSIVYGPDSSVRVWINRWSKYCNETFLDDLPIHEPPGPGPYGNFHPWNHWLGEQLMYLQAKGMDISFGEVFELIELANFGARHPEAFKYALKEVE